MFSGYGHNYSYCFYNSTRHGVLLRILMVYLPIWTSIVVFIISYYKVYSYARLLELGNEKKAILRNLMFYPLTLIIVYLPLSTVRIVEFFYGDCLLYWYIVASIAIFSLHGLMNAYIYIATFKLNKAF